MRLLLTFFLLFSSLSAKQSLKQLYFASKTDAYEALSPDEFELAIDLFYTLLTQEKLQEIQDKRVCLLGLEIIQKKGFFLIRELSAKGRGFYIIRTGAKQKDMISVPHRFHDLKTGNIGVNMMLEHPFRAAAFNTVHRKVMDSAHTQITLFNAFHLAFAKAYDKESIYQLHGFNAETKHSKNISSTSIILSSSSFVASERAKELYICLKKEIASVLLYPKETDELGGTTNATAKLLKDGAYKNFIHLEMSASFRDTLNTQKELRERIFQCLQ